MIPWSVRVESVKTGQSVESGGEQQYVLFREWISILILYQM